MSWSFRSWHIHTHLFFLGLCHHIVPLVPSYQTVAEWLNACCTFESDHPFTCVILQLMQRPLWVKDTHHRDLTGKLEPSLTRMLNDRMLNEQTGRQPQKHSLFYWCEASMRQLAFLSMNFMVINKLQPVVYHETLGGNCEGPVMLQFYCFTVLFTTTNYELDDSHFSYTCMIFYRAGKHDDCNFDACIIIYILYIITI